MKLVPELINIIESRRKRGCFSSRPVQRGLLPAPARWRQERDPEPFPQGRLETGKNPSPNFDVSHYLRTYPDVAAAGRNPVVHYLTHGWKERRSPHPEFDVNRYVSQHSNVDFRTRDPLAHCITTYGSIKWRGAASAKANQQDDAETASPVPVEILDLSEIGPLFDAEYYASMYNDVWASGLDPLSHYVAHGWRETGFVARIRHVVFSTTTSGIQGRQAVPSSTLCECRHAGGLGVASSGFGDVGRSQRRSRTGPPSSRSTSTFTIPNMSSPSFTP